MEIDQIFYRKFISSHVERWEKWQEKEKAVQKDAATKKRLKIASVQTVV